MRGFIVMAMLTASLAQAGWHDFEEERELTLSSSGVDALTITAGAGSLDVLGVTGLNSIDVVAKIGVPNADDGKAAKIIEKRMILSLDKKGEQAELKAWFENGFLGFGSSPYIALDVRVPKGMAVNIDDGSGSIDVADTEGDITIDDGSGSIDIKKVAHVKIDDGSGSIHVNDASGDVSIIDGSGSLTVRGVQGAVTIDDGSGGIRVSDVEKGLVIVDDGSGGQSISNVRGAVEVET